ncbi:TetR/AcrR family transcriptional regulator [Pollutimonas bauzanensis]|uniref:Transcriptional regulator, TetR family n=1 Tax=Pollutimonas bauzanensis TaxID=658167 RepID=A0A1M5Q090_9BURK|nr:TetR/AcrR family transcriptional regulator [Pollutimonas bauzanensis]SHH07574.1 transcriptional regulator, TetR family [Pollutimonas bauzanensis]
MGRASQEQAERNRERVVETACRLFRMHGVENVSIADIMTEAGLTPGGFYKQFASKEALIDEAFALAFRQSSGSWEAIRKCHDANASQALTALVQHYFKQRPLEQNCPMLAFSSLVSNLSPKAQATDVYYDGVEELFGQFREEVLKAPKQGSAKKMSEADALTLFAAMIGTGLLSRAIGHTPWIRQMQSAVLSALPEAELGAKTDTK